MDNIKLNTILTLLLPDTHICVNFSTVYNDTLVAKELSYNLFQNKLLYNKIKRMCRVKYTRTMHIVTVELKMSYIMTK